MKRCPKCNQEFSEAWLTFCTSDGTPLTGTAPPSADYPPPTISMPQPPVTATQDERPTIRMPAPGVGGPVDRWQPGGQPVAPVWQPQYRPANQSQGLAVASLVLGIVSVSVGWCYIGVLTAPIGLILGIVSLLQIKKDPSKYGGKNLAIGGIVTSSIGAVLVTLLFLLIGLSIFSGGIH
jgi:hypothetical protein